MNPSIRLRRHLVVVVLAKLAFLAWFGHWLYAHRLAPVDGASVAAHVSGAAAPAPVSPAAPLAEVPR